MGAEIHRETVAVASGPAPRREREERSMSPSGGKADMPCCGASLLFTKADKRVCIFRTTTSIRQRDAMASNCVFLNKALCPTRICSSRRPGQ
jgi:hypothetical protein